jgi:hypothetical protein
MAQEPISDMQRTQLELLRGVRYNALNGERVVADLLEWRDMWYGVLADRFALALPREEAYQTINLIKLRDLPQNVWNVDTVFIWTTKLHTDTLLERIKQRWKADDFGVAETDEAEQALGYGPMRDDRLIYVWWD